MADSHSSFLLTLSSSPSRVLVCSTGTVWIGTFRNRVVFFSSLEFICGLFFFSFVHSLEVGRSFALKMCWMIRTNIYYLYLWSVHWFKDFTTHTVVSFLPLPSPPPTPRSKGILKTRFSGNLLIIDFLRHNSRTLLSEKGALQHTSLSSS